MSVNQVGKPGTTHALAGGAQAGALPRVGSGSTTTPAASNAASGANANEGQTSSQGNASAAGTQGDGSAAQGGAQGSAAADGTASGKGAAAAASAAANTTPGAGGGAAASAGAQGAGASGSESIIVVNAPASSGGNAASLPLSGTQALPANVDLMDAAQITLNLHSTNSSLLPTDVQVTSQPLSNSLQNFIDAVTQNDTTQSLQQLMQQMTEASQNASSNSAPASQQTQTSSQQQLEASLQQAASEAQQLAHANKLAQQAAKPGETNDAITYALMAELLALSPSAAALGAEEPRPLAQEEAATAAGGHGADATTSANKTVVASLQQDSDVHASALLAKDSEGQSQETGPKFSWASLPQDSDAVRMAQQSDGRIAVNDPNTFFRDADTGKLLMRAGEGPWVVFDSSGRALGQWGGGKSRRNDMKVAGRGQVQRGKDRVCKFYNDCEREGLPSCCQNQGTF